MSERWVEIRIWFTELVFRKLLNEFVKPIIEELEQHQNLETFHFFLEPHFVFRIKPIMNEKIVRDIVKKYMINIKDSITQETFELYEGEESDYGKDGWEIAKKLFEYGSRMILIKNNPEADRGRKFTESKIVHCFLNAQGYSTSFRTIADITINRELIFHLENFIGNLIKIRNKNTVDQEIVRDATIIFEDLLNKIQNSPVEYV